MGEFYDIWNISLSQDAKYNFNFFIEEGTHKGKTSYGSWKPYAVLDYMLKVLKYVCTIHRFFLCFVSDSSIQMQRQTNTNMVTFQILQSDFV